MKKLTLILLMILLIPTFIFAEEFKADELTISLDEEKWNVITRDNLKGNEILETLNITEEYMENFFDNYNAYIDAFVIKDNNVTEIIVASRKVASKKDFNEATDKELKELMNDYIKQTGYSNSELYKNSKYSYIKSTYEDQGLYLIDYYTTMNKKTYTIKFQKSSAITEEEEKELQEIIDSIKFKKNTKSNTDDEKESSSIITNVIIYTIIGGFVGFLVGFVFKKSNNKPE